jgi:hypothetical protein
MESEPNDNVTYIDEFKRKRWLLRLRVARDMGEVILLHGRPIKGKAQIIPFPTNPDQPDGAA